MNVRFDGYYRSGLSEHVNWHAGVRMAEWYYTYVQFFEYGLCLWKKSPTANLDFQQMLQGIDMAAIRRDFPINPPLDAEFDPIYTVQKFRIEGLQIKLEFFWSVAIVGGVRWLKKESSLVLESEQRIVSHQGAALDFVEID